MTMGIFWCNMCTPGTRILLLCMSSSYQSCNIKYFITIITIIITTIKHTFTKQCGHRPHNTFSKTVKSLKLYTIKQGHIYMCSYGEPMTAWRRQWTSSWWQGCRSDAHSLHPLQKKKKKLQQQLDRPISLHIISLPFCLSETGDLAS